MRGRHGPKSLNDLLGDAVAKHDLPGKLVVLARVLAEVLDEVDDLVDRCHLDPRMTRDDVDQSEVVDVLVRQDDQLDVVDRMSVLGELVL